MPHRAAVIVAAAALLLGAESANGAMVTRLDRAGRPMMFDVRAHGVDVNWYAGRLRGSIHGDEITIHERRPPAYPELSTAWPAVPVARLRNDDPERGRWALYRPTDSAAWVRAGEGPDPLELLRAVS